MKVLYVEHTLQIESVSARRCVTQTRYEHMVTFNIIFLVLVLMCQGLYGLYLCHCFIYILFRIMMLTFSSHC
jgi:hypothetical protein